jgi:hypothetical protein
MRTLTTTPAPRPLLAALLLGLAAPAALAADTAPPPPPPRAAAPVAAVDPLAAARGHIANRRWPDAIDALRKVNATGDADWNNLMGYALRKQATPDLDGSQRFYDAALRINPQHQGALEYSAELALMKGDLATAEAKAAALARVCNAPCAPLNDLNKSIASYKAGSYKPY